MAEEDTTDLPEDAEDPGRRHRTMVATRLAVSALIVTIIALLVASVVSGSNTEDSVSEFLRDRLLAVRDANSGEIEQYLAGAGRDMLTFGESEMVAAALGDFSVAFDDLDAADFDDLDREATATFYLDEFLPALEGVRGGAVDPLSIDVGRSSGAAYLQDHYIASNPLPLGQKDLLTDAQDGSDWTEVHKVLHPVLRGDANRLGFEDLYLIEPDNDVVVYSVRKTVEFGTSLDTGPHSGSSLAKLVDRVEAEGEDGVVYVADFSLYTPGLDQPSMFLATPVFVAGDLVGIVAGRLAPDGLNEILSRAWREGRFEETGESYLVASDQFMRSDARPFVEAPGEYLIEAAEGETSSAEEIQLMGTLGSTVTLQQVSTPAVLDAFEGETEVVEALNYRNRDVFSAARPLDTGDLEWVLVTQQEVTELDAPITDALRESVIVTSLFVVGLTFLIVLWANSFIAPVRGITATLKRVKEGDASAKASIGGVREFRTLGSDINQMISDLSAREHEIADVAEQKLDVLRRVLPPSAAQSVGVGDRNLLETVPVASVVVVVFEGLEQLTRSRTVAQNRELVHSFVDEADLIAAEEGLQRIKVIGDTYYAACGLGTPYLDHAPRALRFCEEIYRGIKRLAADSRLDLDLSAGVHSGPVTVGLVGDTRLVYDLWGETVTTAYRLARSTRPGEFAVSDQVRRRLPSTVPARQVDVRDEMFWVIDAAEVSRGAIS